MEKLQKRTKKFAKTNFAFRTFLAIHLSVLEYSKLKEQKRQN